MSAVEKKHPWNVFDGVKIVAVDPPEALMAEINSAIASLEYARAPVFSNKLGAYSEFDARMADEAYKAGMASMAADTMNMFYQEEPPNPFKRFKFLKDLFTKCHSFRPDSIPEEAEPITDFDQQEEVFISAIVGKYIESKHKRRKSRIGIDSFKWPLSPQATEKRSNCGENREEFLSACSRLSRCSSATSFDESFAVKTRFSRSSSLSGTHVNRDYFIGKQSVIIREMIIECEGWPFGLCRKTLLQPPLPKCPSNSWSWRKNGRRVN